MSEPRLTAGTLVGGFEVLEFLNQGGMGTVYVAREAATGARVALKVLSAASVAEVVRFEREGRIGARLHHAHIVTGMGHGRTPDGLAWLAMELLRGQDLEARLAAGRLADADAIVVVRQACEALAYAHAHGVIHRDLKPSNIFVCEGPALEVKVLDFGIARLVNERQFTRSGVLLGTLAYMSPEQARGEREIDPRTDLWSLGVVLYECLSGRRPFTAETALGNLYEIVESDPPDLGGLRPDLPSALVDVVHRTLHKARDGRPASALELRELLAPYVSLATVREGQTPLPVSTSPEGVTALPQEMLASESELRLVTAVVLRDVRDPVFVQRIALELGGRLETLAAGGQLCLFGLDRWSGDEPQRAVRLAVTVASAVRGAGVVTGRVLRSAARVSGAAVDAASLLAEREGVHLDANTVPLVRDGFALVQGHDSTARLDPQSSHALLSTLPASYATPLVGRENELGVILESVAAAAREQRVRVITVLGGAGIGKSRLRHEATARLLEREPTATSLVARCDLYRRATPFAALRDALVGAVDPSAAAVLSVAATEGDSQAEIDRVRASLETLLVGLTERGPVVLALDDAQWLDASSRSALRWICENAPYLPLTLWLFARPEAREALRELSADGTMLELTPLSRPLAERLLFNVAGAAPEALLERAGGHPLFLEELGRVYAQRGAVSLDDDVWLPVSVEGAHLTQLDLIDPADREFLKRAAVFGRHAWVEGVVALGGAADAMPRLVKASLVVPRPRTRFPGAREFAFRAGTLQDVAYGLLPDPHRARLHARAAQWLTERPEVSADELARHWDLAGNRDRAAEAYAAAAEAASRVADTAATSAHTARVLALTQHPVLRWRVLVAQDSALQLGGDTELRRAGLTELVELADRLELRHRVEACWRQCYFARTNMDREVAPSTWVRALELAQALGDPRWSAAVNVELAMSSMDEGRFDDARAYAAAAWDSCGLADDGWLRARAAAARAYVAGETGDLEGSLGLYEVAADGFVHAGDRRREAAVRANSGFIMTELGRIEEAERQITASIEAAQRVGNLATVAMSTHNLGVIRRMLGDLASARVLQERAADLGARIGRAMVRSDVSTERVYLALEENAEPAVCLQRAAEAEQLAEKARAPALVISALAAGLRARARAGATDPNALVAARARLESSQGRGRAELLVALHVVGGRPEDAVAARAAIDAYVARLDSLEDRAASRAAFVRRYLCP